MRYLTICSIASATTEMPRPIARPRSPSDWRQKPKKIVKRISGSIARRESRFTKSSVVKALTIWSGVLKACISPAASIWILAPCAGGKSVTVMSIRIAATAPVTRNTTTSERMTFPRRSIEDIEATALQIVVKTSGTTTINIALIKRSPSGLSTRASLPITAPMTQPIAMAQRRIIGKRYAFHRLFDSDIKSTPFNISY